MIGNVFRKLRRQHQTQPSARPGMCALVGALPRDEFVSVLRTALEREMRDDQMPGFYWVWWAVADEAEARGIDCPLGL
ncbi:hypothetical protein [Streptomyces sp. Root369]|uniref:hypothetical protein n=1 Tax=Streptomyces sp. Root369 TaxID=1736523 RepID=UPI001300F769|nr:hypothetical protein [Streptomyces sp. Root369]